MIERYTNKEILRPCPPFGYASLRVACGSLALATLALRSPSAPCASAAPPCPPRACARSASPATPWHGLRPKVWGSAPTPHPRSRRSPAPASPSAPRATYRTQSQPVQFGNECRIRFPVDRDTGIQSTLHGIPLEGHRIENRTTSWWGLTVFSLLYKTRS